MSKLVYTKKYKKTHSKVFLRSFGMLLIVIGITTTTYIFYPLILWQIFIAPKIISQSLVSPIPRSTFLTPNLIRTLTAQVSAFGTDDTRGSTWFPTYKASATPASVPMYFITIPRLNITDAAVSTVDDDLTKHLVHLTGTAIPPEKGNAVIFGHSTLPELYNFPKDYKTVFAHIQDLQIGDVILVTVNNIIYTYKIDSLTVISPDDTSVLAQTTDDSYLSVITCTPPGTTLYRLVVHARLQTL